MIKHALFTFGGLLLVVLFLLPSSRVSAASHVQKPANNFVATCAQIGVSSGGFLNAECRKNNGDLLFSVLDLNPHVGNNNGSLTTNSRNFVASCQNIGGSVSLTASCRTTNGSFHSASLNLNPFVSNINGNLTWG